MTEDRKSLVSPAMLAALTAPMLNFHEYWRAYVQSDFRKAVLAAWAGDDQAKQAVVQEMLRETEAK